MAEAKTIKRRGFLKALPLAGMAVATPVLAGAAKKCRPAEFADLTRYYAFLWAELFDLSKEMDVDFCHSFTAHRNGDIEALNGALSGSPSTRAVRVMEMLGADCQTLKSAPLSRGNWEIVA
jgi:hypothetical protein